MPRRTVLSTQPVLSGGYKITRNGLFLVLLIHRLGTRSGLLLLLGHGI